MWTEVLQDEGWTTGYVTDNPHILLPVHKNFRKRLDRAELIDGQVPLRRKRPGRSPRPSSTTTSSPHCAARATSRA